MTTGPAKSPTTYRSLRAHLQIFPEPFSGEAPTTIHRYGVLLVASSLRARPTESA
jgi:hypothetical protein